MDAFTLTRAYVLIAFFMQLVISILPILGGGRVMGLGYWSLIFSLTRYYTAQALFLTGSLPVRPWYYSDRDGPFVTKRVSPTLTIHIHVFYIVLTLFHRCICVKSSPCPYLRFKVFLWLDIRITPAV